MTDKQTLVQYRLQQAEETLSDARKMLAEGVSPRSIINRAYYVTFYSIMALFIQSNINPKTSRHSSVISIFDRDFVHTGKVDKRYSKIVHRLFEDRQEADYKTFVELSLEDAEKKRRRCGRVSPSSKGGCRRIDRPIVRKHSCHI